MTCRRWFAVLPFLLFTSCVSSPSSPEPPLSHAVPEQRRWDATEINLEAMIAAMVPARPRVLLRPADEAARLGFRGTAAAASVVLECTRPLREEEVDAVRRLLAASWEALPSEDILIVEVRR